MKKNKLFNKHENTISNSKLTYRDFYVSIQMYQICYQYNPFRLDIINGETRGATSKIISLWNLNGSIVARELIWRCFKTIRIHKLY